MKKIKAFNYVELSLAIVIIGVVFVIFLQIVRPNKNDKNVLFTAFWDNLMKANEELIYLNEQNGNQGLPMDYCSQLVELLSLKSSDCTTGEIVLPNGVEIGGLIDDWNIDPDNPTEFITLDVTSNNSTHSLRVYKADGMVVPLTSDNPSNVTDVFKFKVYNSETMEILNETRNGVSFHDAICYMRGSNYYGIQSCSGIARNTEKCPYPRSCQLGIFMPKAKNLF